MLKKVNKLYEKIIPIKNLTQKVKFNFMVVETSFANILYYTF